MEPLRHWFLEYATLQDFVVEPTGTLLSIFSVVPGLLALPVSIPAVISGVWPDDQMMHNLSKISGTLITTASVLVVYETARRRASHAWAVSIALWYAFGTWSFSVSSQALHSHAPAQLGIALGMLGLLEASTKRWAPFLSGLGFSLATACREDSVFFLAAAGLFHLIHRPRSVLWFCLGAAIPMGFNVIYWFYYTGRLKPPYMGAQAGMFAGVQLEALSAMLISPTRGLLFFSPAAILAIWAGVKRIDLKQGLWIAYMLGACAVVWMFISMRTTWSGGQTFGTRYFAAACVVFAAILASSEDAFKAPPMRRLFAGAWAASVLTHALGGYFTYPGSFAITEQISQVWNVSYHPWIHLFYEEGSFFKFGAAARAALTLLVLSTLYPLYKTQSPT